MAVQGAQVIDLQAYRNARNQDSSAVQGKSPARQPFVMWMPVWAFVPVPVGMWNYGY